MRLGEALDAEQAVVELLLKRTGGLQKTLKQWSKACQEGTLPAREKAANLSVERARELVAPRPTQRSTACQVKPISTTASPPSANASNA